MAPRRNPQRPCRRRLPQELVEELIEVEEEEAARNGDPEEIHPLIIEKPPTLPFLGLPFVVQEVIMKHSDLIDVVSLSLCSHRVREIVHTASFMDLKNPNGLLTGGTVQVEFTTDKVTVLFQDTIPRRTFQVQVLESQKKFGSVLFRKSYRIEREYGKSDSQERRLTDIHIVAYCARTRLKEAARSAIEHIAYIFRLPVNRVSVDVDDIPEFSSLFIWKFLKESCSDVELYGSEVLDDELHKLFRKCTAVKRLALEVDNTGNLSKQFSKIRDLKFLALKNGSWMKNHHFVKMNCEFMKVFNTKVSAKAINVWLKRWFESSETDTKVLMIDTQKVTCYNSIQLFAGLPRPTYRVEHRERLYAEFGSFYRFYYGEPSAGVMRPEMRCAMITRADGAVAKVAEGRDQMCIYMTYN